MAKKRPPTEVVSGLLRSRHLPRNIFSCSSQVSGRLLVGLASVHRVELIVDDRPDDGRRHRRQPDEACHIALVLANSLKQYDLHLVQIRNQVWSNRLYPMAA